MLLSTFDAAGEFSTITNPTGPWTYGVRYTEFADFASYSAAGGLDFAPNSTQGWSENSGSPPYIGINSTGAELDAEGIELPTGVLVMHPGGNGEYSDLRFNVDNPGDVNINYQFAGVDSSGTTTDVHILYNSQSIFDGNIDSNSPNLSGRVSVPNAAQNDVIDIVVGDGENGNFYDDATSVGVQIETAASQNHLVFTKQPADGDIHAPETVQVKIEDANNKVVTTKTNGVLLDENIPAGSYPED